MNTAAVLWCLGYNWHRNIRIIRVHGVIRWVFNRPRRLGRHAVGRRGLVPYNRRQAPARRRVGPLYSVATVLFFANPPHRPVGALTCQTV